jgi:cellulose synthase/poly-beta-1,6-N-acetylglucosamine synthase-like glycosyltransferase
VTSQIWRYGDENAEDDEQFDEKKPPRVTANEIDEESGELLPENRPTHLMNTILVSITLCLIIVMLGAGWRQLAVEVMVDQQYIRLAFVLLTPIQVFFTLFFAQVIVGCLAQCLGPIKQMKENSRFYSAMLPRRLTSRPLPHLTVQCPVYKEGLAGVIAPTVRSLKEAITTYELQGGSANIFVNDDGLQIIDEEERQARIDFYADNSIGWTARPKHGSEGFIRRGKFKKASNMNYGLNLSCGVEAKLANIDRHEGWTQNDEAMEYERCLREVLEENGRAWADGNIRIGDYILIIDSDTRVPKDCLLDAVSEMDQSPEVGIMQFSSGVMQVVGDFFENVRVVRHYQTDHR